MSKSPSEILQDLIRFDTTNPPGNERACVEYLERLFAEHGFETNILASDGQHWDHSPFSGEIAGGFIWGRGANDMKAGLAMMATALLRIKVSDEIPPGDLIFAAVSDEERDSGTVAL
jgi:acetylornithine deacetylase/succinyl-diaminopimelate desuccinylase-like protein